MIEYINLSGCLFLLDHYNANGNYIGTFLKLSSDIPFACLESNPPTCTSAVLLILPTDYFLTISDTGGLGSLSGEAWDNSNCSGTPSLLFMGDYPALSFGNIFSISHNIPSSPAEYISGYAVINGQGISGMVQTWTYIYSTDPYYLPNNPVVYNGTAYAWRYVLNPTTTYYDLVCQEVAGNYYKLIPNDPAVTGYDPVYINSLQKPFRISIK